MSEFSHDFYHDAQYGHDPGVYDSVHHGAHYGVDGGGLGHHHGGHQGQNFDSQSYANAFGGHAHHHGGGIIAQLLGLNTGHGGHHGWLAQLLGLDSKHHYVHHTPPEVTRQGQFLWENLGRVFKHDLFNEFEVTPGKLFLVLLVAMIGWLFVLNFTRHHESQVNAWLGANVAQVAAYESTNRLLNQPNQAPVELPSNSMYGFYMAPTPNKFELARRAAKPGQGFVSSMPNNTSGSSNAAVVQTPDGRIQTIVNR